MKPESPPESVHSEAKRYISKESSGFYKKDSSMSGSSKKSNGMNGKKGDERNYQPRSPNNSNNIYSIPEKGPVSDVEKIELNKPKRI